MKTRLLNPFYRVLVAREVEYWMSPRMDCGQDNHYNKIFKFSTSYELVIL